MYRSRTILKQAVLASLWFGVAVLVGPPRWSDFSRLWAIGRGTTAANLSPR